MAASESCTACLVPFGTGLWACPNCGTPRNPGDAASRLPGVDVSAAIVPARAASLALGVIIDLAALAVAAGLAALLFAVHPEAAVSLGVVVLLFVAAAQLVGLVATGATLGWLIAGIRLVARSDASPLGLARLGALPPTAAVDVRRGRDPITPLLAVFEIPATGAPLAAAARGAAPVDVPRGSVDAARQPASRAGTVYLVVKGKARQPIAGTMLVGRNPVAEPGTTPVAIPDLTRTVSKTHLRLEHAAGDALYATDLGSTNGSTVRHPDGTATPLVPHVRTALDLADVLDVGDHELRFETRTRQSEQVPL